MTKGQQWERLIKSAMKTRFAFEGITFMSIRASQAIRVFAATKK